MIPNFVEDLNIEDVQYVEKFKVICISIKFDEFNYRINRYHLELKKLDGTYYPYTISHGINCEECPCGSNKLFHTCEFLSTYVDEIYEKIKNHPRIRMHLLFL